jgi:hypothetical protein
MNNDRSKLRPWRERPAPAIPLYLSIEHGGEHHDDDTLEHEVQFFVVGALEPTATLAVVQSDCYKNPRVLRYERAALLGLRTAVLDQVVVRAFRTLAHHMNEADGDAAEMWVSDAAVWLGRWLTAGEAAEAVVALAPYVRLGCAVNDVVSVRID